VLGGLLLCCGGPVLRPTAGCHTPAPLLYGAVPCYAALCYAVLCCGLSSCSLCVSAAGCHAPAFLLLSLLHLVLGRLWLLAPSSGPSPDSSSSSSSNRQHVHRGPSAFSCKDVCAQHTVQIKKLLACASAVTGKPTAHCTLYPSTRSPMIPVDECAHLTAGTQQK
jgi:hypothetical protein